MLMSDTNTYFRSAGYPLFIHKFANVDRQCCLNIIKEDTKHTFEHLLYCIYIFQVVQNLQAECFELFKLI